MRTKLLAVAVAVLCFGAVRSTAQLIDATGYPFVSTTAALEDMSSGTTVLVGPALDDNASVVTNIGFDFFYNGVRRTQFSANANGLIRLGAVAVSTGFANGLNNTTDTPKIAPFSDDLCTGTNGQIHFKVVGTAPSRRLVVEFQNMQITRGAGCAGPGTGTFQAWLFETTGVIQFVYGALPAANAVDGGYSIGLQAGAATNFASVTTSTNTASYAAANNTQTTAIPATTSYTFTPPAPGAPSGLNFTGTTAIATTLNWTDGSTDELGFAIYRSLDGGVTFSFLAQTAANAVSFADNTLAPSTNYVYNVIAFREGALSAPASNSVTSSAAGNVSSTGAGGLWSLPGTWSGGNVPTSSDNVTIVDGSTVVIDTAAAAYSVTVGQSTSGVLEYEATTARTLTVGANLTVAANGTLRSAASGTQTAHVLSLAGNLINDGTLDFSTNADTAGAGIVFTGIPNTTFSGSGATTDIRGITVNKGTTSTSILEITTANFSVQGVTTDVTGGWYVMANGTLKLSGTFSGTNRVFASAGYTIAAPQGFWLNNPNYVVAGQTGSPVNAGLLRISQGTFNVGTVAGNSMTSTAGAVYLIEGGTANFAGRLVSTAAVSYTQTGGTVNVSTIGNAAAQGAFHLSSAAATFTMSNGQINLVQASTNATPLDFQNSATSTITGGSLRTGTGATATNFNFRVRGNAPSLTVDNTTNNKTATAVAQLNLHGTTTISSGATLNLNGQVCLVLGTSFVNNGTLNGTTALTRFYFLGGNGAQTYSGSGVVTAPLVAFEVDNIAGVTLNLAVNPVVTSRINVFNGSIAGASRLTLGNGGATTGVVQMGLGTAPAPSPGSLDAPPTFNAGSGGYIYLYLLETSARVAGNELVPSHALTTLTVNNPLGVTFSGVDVSVSGVLTLTAGRAIMSAPTRMIPNGTVVRTAGWIDGIEQLTLAAGARTFDVGTANGYSPVAFNVTAGAPAVVTARAIEGAHPDILGAPAIERHWTLNATGVTADLTFTYLDPTDLAPQVVNENNLRVYRRETPGPPAFTDLGGTVTAFANTVQVTGVTQFSDWTLAEAGASPVELLEFAVE